MTLRVGIDVGGTFTDFVAYDDQSGEFYDHKVLTTPKNPNEAIGRGIAELLARTGSKGGLGDAEIVHGTTLVANTLIQRTGSPTALIVSAGARDILQTGRENRYDPYDRMLIRPTPLVDRRFRREVNERLSANGTVLEALDGDEVRRLLLDLAREGIAAVAVCFLHSYVDPTHEQRVCEIAKSVVPDLYVSLSSEVAAEIGEWERMTTTAANAYIQPTVERYLRALESTLAACGHAGRLFLMWSDGGLASPDATLQAPIRLLESGPAAGALAAVHVAQRNGLPRVIAVDVGGTTAKICLIADGEPTRTPSFEVGRLHRHRPGSGILLRVPSVQMLEIGSGGGSVARVDDLGLLKVGPQSAGAMPGPACYGFGGAEPTVTDANLVLGYLSEETPLADSLKLDHRSARAALVEIAGELNMTTETAAAGIRRVVNEQMAQAIRFHVTERGEDPRDYALMAFGGAAPLHIYDIARILGIRQVIIPRRAGVFSSLGFLTSAAGLEVARTFITPLDTLDIQALHAILDDLHARAAEALASAGVSEREATFHYMLEMRYIGQGYQIQVPIPSEASFETSQLIAAFEEAYRSRFGVTFQGSVEIRACRLRAEGPQPTIAVPTMNFSKTDPSVRVRKVWYDELNAWADAAVYKFDGLSTDTVYEGPLLIEGQHTTIAVGPHGKVHVSPSGDIVLELSRRDELAITTATGRIDPVDLEIILSRLRSIADEADAVLMRTAFSSVVRDGKDYSLVIADPAGNCLAFPTECMPLFVTSMPRSIALLAERFPTESLRQGDIILTNDPWLCAGHKSDLLLLAPVFDGQRLVAFIATILHVPDIGGVLGDFRAWDLYEEGLAIPPVKLYDEGRLNDAVAAILSHNVRVPEHVVGDIVAMRTAIAVVTTRLPKLLRDLRDHDLAEISNEISQRARAAFLERVRALPRGVYRASFDADGVYYGDGAARRSIHLEAAIKAADDGLIVDFTGTERQRPRQAINVPIPYTIADTLYALQYMLAPGLPNLGPQFSPIKILAPEGSILNAQPPVPVFARTRTGVHIATVINRALAEAAPDLVQAGCGHNIILSITGVDDRGRYSHVTMMPKGGMGATGGRDGWDVTVFPTNCTMISTEIAEVLCPILISREMTCDSGGPGRERGGTGQTVTIRSLADRPLTFAIRANFMQHRPSGLNGGGDGGAARVEVNNRPVDTDPIILQPGEECRIWTAGGGGIGDPLERSVLSVEEDIRAGLVSIRAARDVYGVVFDSEKQQIDVSETRRLRTGRCG